MHEIWLRFVEKSLPYLDRSLPSLGLHVAEQLSRNLQFVVDHCYYESEDCNSRSSVGIEFPTNYVYLVLESLTTLFHHCLFDSCMMAGGTTGGQTAAVSGTTTAQGTSSVTAVRNATGEILTNLVRVFTFQDANTGHASSVVDNSANFGSLARSELLGAFPHVLSTLCNVWSAVKDNKPPKIPVGMPQHVRRLILDLLSPIAVNHSSHFLSSVALVWLTRGQKTTKTSPTYSFAQMDIADLLLSIKMFPFESLLTAAGQTLKEPVRIKNINEKDVFPVEVSVLEIVDGCLLFSPVSLLRTSWPSIYRLLMDVQSLNPRPPALFMSFFILVDYVRLCCGYNEDDKATLRGMQEICVKITESMNTVVGWQLEQTTWLKRTLVVRRNSEAGQPPAKTESSGFLVHSSTGENLNLMERSAPPGDNHKSSITNSLDASSKSEKGFGLTSKDSNNNRRETAYSTQALYIFAENLSTVIDTICKSEDKERLLPTLHAVWNNIMPYLKTRSERNAKNFYASSKFLANLSQFSYTRPVWRKAALELVADSSFFRMDVESLRCWLTVVDNLMTHDKTTFKDLLSRISVSQGPSLFTSRDQEYDMRAAALKRLAFVLLSSEIDQYHPHLPDIQERLTENLRLFQVPHVHAQVFFCFRVLLIRLSPSHLTSIWPALITELVQVLLQIEQDLTDGPVVNNDYRCAREDQWLQLYLSACKLLDVLCTLPSWHLTQFQMYQWAFATPVEMDMSRKQPLLFVPHVTRINEMLKRKYGLPKHGELEGAPSLSQIRSVSRLKDLRFFFYQLADTNLVTRKSVGPWCHESSSQDSKSILKNIIQTLESSLYVDFMESWH